MTIRKRSYGKVMFFSGVHRGGLFFHNATGGSPAGQQADSPRHMWDHRWHLVNRQAVRILLECMPVFIKWISTHLLSAFIRYLNQVHEVIPPSYQRTFFRVAIPSVMGGTMWSAHLIVFTTFERFYSIIRPHMAASFNTVKRAKITIVSIIVLGILFNMPYAFIGDNTGTFCIVNNDVARSLPGQIFYWLHFTVSFALPFVFLISMNTVIIHTLRKRSQWVTSQGQSQGQSTKNTERQIYIILLLVTFGFLTLTTPAYAMLIWINFTAASTSHFYAAYHLFTNVAEKSYYTNNGINFFLYVMSGKKFRADLMKTIELRYK